MTSHRQWIIAALWALGLAALAACEHATYLDADASIPTTAMPDATGNAGHVRSSNLASRSYVGSKRILVLILDYPGDGQGPVASTEQTQNIMEVVETNFEANAYGRLDIEYDIAPVLTMPQGTAFYQGAPYPFLTRMRADALALAEQAGYREEDYDREVVFTSKLWNTPWMGFGDNGRTAVVGCACDYLTIHELAHTNLWAHASFWQVAGNDPLATQGQAIEYGDVYDPLGSRYMRGIEEQLRHSNPWFKFRAGWLTEDEVPVVTSSGVYTIQTLSRTPGTIPSALRIRIDADTNYWVFHRDDPALLNQGVLISRAAAQGKSMLLDMTPSSIEGMDDVRDAALEPGRTFTDAILGVSVEVLSTSNAGAEVAISFDPQSTSLGYTDPPVVELVTPEVGHTIAGTQRYEVDVYDPSVAAENGAGISSVTLSLRSTANESGPATVTQEFDVPPYAINVDTESLADGMWALNVRAIRTDGTEFARGYAHLIDNTGPSF